jgi:hypothetical protein
VRNWIDAGKLPAIHIGRRVRDQAGRLERLLEQAYHHGAKMAPPEPVTSIWDGEIPPPLVP